MPVLPEWLSQVTEDIIDPNRPIVDPHHHFWHAGHREREYLLDDLWADTNSGHRIEQTVFVECHADYLEDGPEEMRPIGETKFVAGLAAQSAEGDGAQVTGIVGHANLALGSKVKPVLEAHIEAGQGLFRGIRHHGSWDPSPDVPNSRIEPPPHLFLTHGFQEGVRRLGALRAELRLLELSSADPGSHRPRKGLCRYYNHPQPSRGCARHRSVRRPARRGLRPVETGLFGTRPAPPTSSQNSGALHRV